MSTAVSGAERFARRASSIPPSFGIRMSTSATWGRNGLDLREGLVAVAATADHVDPAVDEQGRDRLEHRRMVVCDDAGKTGTRRRTARARADPRFGGGPPHICRDTGFRPECQ